MLESHRQIINRVTQRFGSDPDVIALIVIGSVARGDAHEHSDVDALVILSDEAYARYQASSIPLLGAEELAGKQHEARPTICDKVYLRAAAERGPEPPRFAFVQAVVPFSRDPEI